MLSKLPRSCDTFVVLPPLTKNQSVVFGKNSDRPQNEVQEVVLVKGGPRDDKLKCTYITIDGFSPVNTVILSKPAWMWGAEMGANDKNVVIGNEAVWTNNNEGEGDARPKRLLGMDLVRLGLERANTAEGALDVITSLLEKYGQGGPCSEHDDSHIYHNSFLIADTKEAWVLETSGKLWAAERVTSGYRNISNGLTIATKIDKHANNLMEKSKRLGLWDGQSEFNFTRCFSSGGDEQRQQEGARLLKEGSSSSAFDVRAMMNVLRHKDSRICRSCDDTFPTQGSQVSSLSDKTISVHWFTATPDPSMSFFKPFVFTKNAQASPFIVSPDKPLREHHLYKLHMERISASDNEDVAKVIQVLEEDRLAEIETYANDIPTGQNTHDKLDNLLKDCAETEVNLYAI
ncbi:unnamed protein product [Spodoptera littoralis]|uniref:Secernin-2 n=1 Tax=Spodoptera littoralis TaxID=7109 RepID=A0A9P0NAN1_SPOLI|nr:unnamed protein product [Spodoptera littoralis]CAH1647592.1 unnamed protein product [Spodoptera littoralis]